MDDVGHTIWHHIAIWSNILIWVAYLWIPRIIWERSKNGVPAVRNEKEQIMYLAFIISCAFSHLVMAINIIYEHGLMWSVAVVMTITAMVSLATAVYMAPEKRR